MSQKRKHEEYHDPDYPQFPPKHHNQTHILPSKNHQISPKKSKISPTIDSSSEDRIKKICDIVQNEFESEIRSKEREIDEIEKRLSEAKQLLAKVRYAVVYNYYTKKNLVYNVDELKNTENLLNEPVATSRSEASTSAQSSEVEKIQPAIHPSLKKLLGKRPVDYNEILKVRSPREAARNATQRFHKTKKSHKACAQTKEEENVTIETNVTVNESDSDVAVSCDIKKPRYVAPNTNEKSVEQVNSTRGRNHFRHLLVVGNTSKYLGDEEDLLATNVTHKWLVYIATKTIVPVEQILNKVRFYLHESYKPNDIVEVNSPPFQISKRGWGEFSIRVQLFFHPHLLQKPIQIFHNLILDKKHTGLQTMGAETIVELWLNIPDSLPEESNCKEIKTEHLSSSNLTCKALSENLPTKLPVAAANTINNFSNIEINHNSDIKVERHLLSDQKINDSTVSVSCTPSLSTKSTVVSAQPNSMIEQQNLFKSNAIDAPAQNIENIRNNSMTPKAKVMQPPKVLPLISSSAGKKFIKCVDKNGKVSLIEMLADPTNPKIFKMALPDGQKRTATVVHNQQAGNSIIVGPKLISLPKQLILQKSTKVCSNNVTNIAVLPASTAVTQSKSNIGMVVNNTLAAITGENVLGATKSALVTNPISLISTPMESSHKWPPSESNTKAIATGSARELNPKKTVLMKNNKIFAIDPAIAAKIRPAQQQSLLKPQISLLKSSAIATTPTNIAQASVSKTISTNENNFKVITISNICGLEHKNIKVFMPSMRPAESKLVKDLGKEETNAILKNKKFVVNVKAPRQFAIDLERQFYQCDRFVNVTSGISWLLKRTSLFTPLAMQHGYRESFPFAVDSEHTFYNLPVAKQRSFEWLRAKYVQRLALAHSTLKPLGNWTTKQIILYGRKFGYSLYSPYTDKEMAIKTRDLHDVKNIVKIELVREHLQNDVISFNHRIAHWMQNVEQNLINSRVETAIKDDGSDDTLIIVDDIDLDRTIAKESIPRDSRNGAYTTEVGKLYLPIQNEFQQERYWIGDICRSAQISLQPEELIKGVVHRSAEQVLITAMRSFVEDLLRKSAGNKLHVESKNADLNSPITNDDIQRAFSMTKRFDFLTNKHFGVEKAIPTE